MLKMKRESIKISFWRWFKFRILIVRLLIKLMIDQKQLGRAIDIIEIFITTPFKKANELTFYDFASFYLKFAENLELKILTIYKVHLYLYQTEIFTLKSIKHDYGIQQHCYKERRTTLNKLIAEGKLLEVRDTLPIESLLFEISTSLPSIEYTR